MEQRMGLLQAYERSAKAVYEGRPLELLERNQSLPPPPDKPVKVAKPKPERVRAVYTPNTEVSIRALIAAGHTTSYIITHLSTGDSTVKRVRRLMQEEAAQAITDAQIAINCKEAEARARTLLAEGASQAYITKLTGVSATVVRRISQTMPDEEAFAEAPPPPAPAYTSSGEGVRCHVLDWDTRINAWGFDGPAWPKCRGPKHKKKGPRTSARKSGEEWAKQLSSYQSAATPTPRHPNPFD
jgi:hypothetical protein